MHIGDEHEQAGEVLSAGDDAELGRLLDGVRRIGPGVGESDDLGARGLRLQQERREVLRREQVAHGAEHLAAVLLHHRRRVALERMAEGIVGGEEEPRIAASLHHGGAVPLAGA